MKRPEPHGTPARWQQGRSGWRYGFINGDDREPDGSVRVWDNYTGGARSLPANVVQHQTLGPRGGKRWDWIETPPTPTVTAACTARPAWNPPPGAADLFNQDTLFDLGDES